MCGRDFTYILEGKKENKNATLGLYNIRIKSYIITVVNYYSLKYFGIVVLIVRHSVTDVITSKNISFDKIERIHTILTNVILGNLARSNCLFNRLSNCISFFCRSLYSISLSCITSVSVNTHEHL